MFTTTARRVPDNTTLVANERIRRRTQANVTYYAHHRDEIGRRLVELDQEWDVERILETGSSALTLSGLLLGITRNRKWLLLSLAVQGFFMQHALQGWCPPLPVLRRLGFRTADEINEERCALRALSGDVERVGQPGALNAGTT